MIVSRYATWELAHVGLDLELALHAVDEDVQVQLAHALDEGLAGPAVLLDAERRVLFNELLDSGTQLLLVSLGLRLDGDLDDEPGRSSTRAPGQPGASGVLVVVSLRPMTA